MLDQFNQISIRGRYIYCYVCLRNVIASKHFDNIPDFLDIILKLFTLSSELDVWQDSADEVLPSVILDSKNEISRFKVIPHEQILALKVYYLQNELVANMIEHLIWLGMSNLYGGFNSAFTLDYVKDVIDLMHSNKVELPNFLIVNSCSVNELGGWGNRVELDSFLVNNS